MVGLGPLHASRITHHASRFTLHASRFTLHASRFTLHASRKTIMLAHRRTHVPHAVHAGGKDHQITFAHAHGRATFRRDDDLAFEEITGLFALVEPQKKKDLLGPGGPGRGARRGGARRRRRRGRAGGARRARRRV